MPRITLAEALERAARDRGCCPPATGPTYLPDYLREVPVLDRRTQIGTLFYDDLIEADRRRIDAVIQGRIAAVRRASMTARYPNADVSAIADE